MPEHISVYLNVVFKLVINIFIRKNLNTSLKEKFAQSVPDQK